MKTLRLATRNNANRTAEALAAHGYITATAYDRGQWIVKAQLIHPRPISYQDARRDHNSPDSQN